MRSWNLALMARAAGATLRGGGAVPKLDVEAVSTDSRATASRCLFVALRGERFDGHAFVEAAIGGGALAVLVDSRGVEVLPPTKVPTLVVPDTLRALGDIAAWVRLELGEPLAAITGSNGKTTTKELLAAALGARGMVHKTEGNLNNLIGVPQTLFRWRPEAWAAVVEMGMNAPGEIARLTDIAQPNVGLVTCVAPAHLEGLGSLEAIADAKAELFAHLPDNATAILNADDVPLVRASARVLGARRVLRFGHGEGCDVRLLTCVAEASGLRMAMSLDGQAMEVALPLVGRHNAMNAAGAAATAWAMGLSPDEIARGLPAVRVPGARLKVLRQVGPGINVVDDTYNANPGSMKAAFATLRDLAGGARCVAVLGDMFELGEAAPALHHEVGQAAAAAGVAEVLAVGPLSERTAAGAVAGGARGRAFADVEALAEALSRTLRAGDWLLVKGSRGMRMEQVVQRLAGGRP
jgi:UDP-N-acetylmuramoyl-tripeptide--D-alanyl-D-alanine ligase